MPVDQPDVLPVSLLENTDNVRRKCLQAALQRVATGALLDPIRLFWLASLSVQKHPGRFLRLVGALSREFFQKIRYPRKIATGYRAAAIR